jgi:hypothetical protein
MHRRSGWFRRRRFGNRLRTRFDRLGLGLRFGFRLWFGFWLRLRLWFGFWFWLWLWLRFGLGW